MSLKREAWLQLPKTYPLEIPVDHSLAVHVDQAACGVAQLQEPCNHQKWVGTAGARVEDIRVQTDLHPDVLLQNG